MKISIVTPSLNRRAMISAALQSLSDQHDEDVEHIVVDGGSTDGTVDLIREQFPQVRLVVQSDKNLYEAINRALVLCRGDVIGLLNSDDILLPGALASVRAGFAVSPLTDAVCGGCALHSIGEGRDPSTERVYNTHAMKALRGGDIISGLILTNGRFFRRSVFQILGDFDDTIPTLADREFLARFHLAGLRTVVIGNVIYSYGCHSQSLTFNGEVSPAQLAEATTTTRRLMAEAKTPQHRAFFRRWHGWASGYECMHILSKLQFRDFMALFIRASLGDPLWLLFFVRQLWWHLRTRAERLAGPPLNGDICEAYP